MATMNRTRCIAQCCLSLFAAQLALTFAASAQTTNWQSYSYPADGFQASFPSVPDLEKKDVPSEAGSFEVRSYTAQVGSVALFVVVCDYGLAASGKDPDSLLQGAKNAVLQNPISRLVSEKKIPLGANHGLELEAENDAELSIVRMYMVGSTLYQTLVVAPRDKPYAETTRFLDSFQLVARTGNQGASEKPVR